MLKRLCLIGTLALLAHGGAAYAASTPTAPGDPPAGSPSGQVYELPFDKGRADAAPKGNGGTGGPTAADNASANPSLYRSENNFGSSSQVPGAPPPGKGNSGGSGHSGPGGTGAGDGATGTGGGPIGADLAASDVTGTGNTSTTGTVALLGVIALVGVAVGAVSIGAKRLRSQ